MREFPMREFKEGDRCGLVCFTEFISKYFQHSKSCWKLNAIWIFQIMTCLYKVPYISIECEVYEYEAMYIRWNIQKLPEGLGHLYQSLFFSKTIDSVNSFKRRVWNRGFYWEFHEIFRTTFFIKHLRVNALET